jgi:hypothetical protein
VDARYTVDIGKIIDLVSLLGGTEHYLIYLTKGNDIGCINRFGSKFFKRPLPKFLNHHPLGRYPILAYNFDKRSDQLLVATENNILHQIKVNVDKSCFDFQEHSFNSNENWDLTTVSKNGDIAFHDKGNFHILNPLKSIEAKYIQFGNFDNNSGGPTCFAGENHQYLVYCGTKRIGIGLAKLDNDGWVFYQDISAKDLKEYIPDAIDLDKSPLRDPQFSGRILMIRVDLDKECKANWRCLLLNLPT